MQKIRKTLKIKELKEKVPIFIRSSNLKNKKAIIAIQGLGGSGSSIFGYDIDSKLYQDFSFFGFDSRAHHNNKNKPSSYPSVYLEDFHLLILELVKKYNLEQIYLIGESWGASLIYLYQAKYQNPIVKKAIGWNMPYNVVKNDSNYKEKIKLISTIKVLLTYLFNINTYEIRAFNTELTNNELIKRINKNPTKQSNRLAIAAFRSFKKSWKMLFENKNFIYIQSMQDVLKTKDWINKNKNKIIILEKGTHILALDKFESKTLFKLIFDIIEEKR